MPKSDLSDATPSGAIAAALRQDWKEAIRINTQLLKTHKHDIDASCRLAFAYMKTGQLQLAKAAYEKVIKMDQYNQIALKNLARLTTLKKKNMEESDGLTISPLLFLEEPGITKMAECMNLAPISVLSTLSAGQELMLKPKKHCVELRTIGNTYAGALPDDLSFKLNKLIEAGNTYQTIIKSVDKKSLKVVIRELTRGKKFAHQPSFISTTSYAPMSRTGTPTNVDMPDMTPTGEDDGDDKEDAEE